MPPPDQSRLHQPRHPRFDAIHRALLTGLLSNVGTKTETHEYLAPRNIRFSVFPGSALFGQKQKWLMAAELVETTKLYARTCAGIQPQWIEHAADHLVERTYSEPRWDSKTASALVTEKVTLHGLVLVAARTVPYSPIHPRHARELFIHNALVLGDYRTDAPFARHNARLVEEVQQLEAKIRQRNLLADAATRYAFYDARVPHDVTNGPQFESWRRRVEPRVLHMDKADLLRADAPAINAENYPDRLADTLGGRGNVQLPLVYKFEPGEANDGLTLTVPVAALAQLRAERYEWLVPGMLEEKIAAMLRELPGHLRRNFVPVPTWAKSAAEALAKGEHADRSLRDALAEFLATSTGVEINGADLPDATLPPFLRMAFRVVNDTGVILAFSRDLAQVQRRAAPQTADSFVALYKKEFTRDHVATWDFGDLPESITLQRFGMSITAFPALTERDEQCALRLLPTRQAAEAAHRAGVRRLFRLEHRRDVKDLAAQLPHFPEMALKHFTLGESKRLREDLVTLVLDRALFADAPVPRGKEAFERESRVATERLAEMGNATAQLASGILDEYHLVSLAMERPAQSAAYADVREQMLHLIPPHFLMSTPFEWLQQYPRYLASMRLRLQKLETGGPEIARRDLDAMTAIAPWWNQYLHRRQQHDETGFVDLELALFRWMLEEYRVHLFTQELGTVMPVSPKRLEKQWEKTRRVGGT